MPYLIRFDFPDAPQPLYGGMYHGALGWAPTTATANEYDDRETAERVLVNGYGASAEYGTVVDKAREV
jgi:hypothetical protein